MDSGELFETADLLRDGFCEGHGRHRGGRNAVGEAIAANTWLPIANSLSTVRNMSAQASRAACNGIAAGHQASSFRTADLVGRGIDVPSCFISGKQDWGTYQRPGVYEAMQGSACTRMLGCHLVDGAVIGYSRAAHGSVQAADRVFCARLC